MPTQETIFPYEEFQISDVKILRTREDIANHLNKDTPINFLEVGTGSGDFAQMICDSNNVDTLTIIDTFPGHEDYLGRYGKTSQDQKNFVKDRFNHINKVNIITGFDTEELPKLYRKDPFTKYDFIYIDADHSFTNVIHSLFWASMLLKPHGIIGLDDYCFKPDGPIGHMFLYEVQEALSAFLKENHNWKIKYFSFGINGFQNVFIQRIF